MSCAIQNNYEMKTIFLKKNSPSDVVDYLINNHGNRGWEFVSSTKLTNLDVCQTYTFRRIRSNN